MACQVLYSLAFLIDLYFSLLPVDAVDMAEADDLPREGLPYIVLFYPVLKEQESTMRTTFVSLGDLRYAKDRYRVVAIPNMNDIETVASLRRLQRDFSFLQIVVVPPTTASSWQASGMPGTGRRRPIGGTTGDGPAIGTCLRRRPGN